MAFIYQNCIHSGKDTHIRMHVLKYASLVIPMPNFRIFLVKYVAVIKKVGVRYAS